MLLDYHEVIITKGVGGRGVGLSDYHEFITKGVGGRGGRSENVDFCIT